jgi:hypothetical protein
MNKNIFAVISNYNSDPTWLFKYYKNFLIFDQSDDIEVQTLLNKKSIPYQKLNNSGHNLSSIFTFILQNYNNLPRIMVFIKSTVVPRHCSLTYFESVFSLEYFTAFWSSDKEFSNSVDRQTLSGFITELNNNWYVKSRPHKYFCQLNDLLEFIFFEPFYPQHLTFIPGANFICESSRLLKFPPQLYKFLDLISSYEYFPSEAYMVERILPLILFSNKALNSRFSSEEQLLKDLMDLSFKKCNCSRDNFYFLKFLLNRFSNSKKL